MLGAKNSAVVKYDESESGKKSISNDLVPTIREMINIKGSNTKTVNLNEPISRNTKSYINENDLTAEEANLDKKLPINTGKVETCSKNEELEKILGHYIEYFEREYGDVKFYELRIHSLDINLVYEPVDFYFNGDGVRQTINDILDFPSRVLITGERGSGKTTFLKWLTMNVPTFAENVLPIYLMYEQLITMENESYENLIQEKLREADLKVDLDFIKSMLECGKIMLLIDGYDEILQNKRRRFKRTIDILKLLYPTITIIVTSQNENNEYSSLREFKLYKLAYLTKKQMRNLIFNYLNQIYLVKTNSAAKDTDILFDYLCYNDSLYRLLTNPGLLVLFLLNIRLGGKYFYPSTVNDFFEKTFELLFQFRNSNNVYIGNRVQGKSYLYHIAFMMIWKDVDIINIEDITDYLKNFTEEFGVSIDCTSLNTSDPIFYQEYFNKILLLINENNFRFSYPYLRDYLAGQAIKERYYSDFLEEEQIVSFPYAGIMKTRWKRAIVFAISKSDRITIDKFINYLLKDIDMDGIIIQDMNTIFDTGCFPSQKSTKDYPNKNLASEFSGEDDISRVDLLFELLYFQIPIAFDLEEKILVLISKNIHNNNLERLKNLIKLNKYRERLCKIVYEQYSKLNSESPYYGLILAMISLEQLGWEEEFTENIISGIKNLLNSDSTYDNVRGTLALIQLIVLEPSKSFSEKLRKSNWHLSNTLIKLFSKEEDTLDIAVCWVIIMLQKRDLFELENLEFFLVTLIKKWINNTYEEVDSYLLKPILNVPTFTEKYLPLSDFCNNLINPCQISLSLQEEGFNKQERLIIFRDLLKFLCLETPSLFSSLELKTYQLSLTDNQKKEVSTVLIKIAKKFVNQKIVKADVSILIHQYLSLNDLLNSDEEVFLANAYRKKGQFLSELEWRTKVLEINPDNVYEELILGDIYFHLGAIDKTLEICRKCIGKNIELSEAEMLAIQYLFHQTLLYQERYDEALDIALNTKSILKEHNFMPNWLSYVCYMEIKAYIKLSKFDEVQRCIREWNKAVDASIFEEFINFYSGQYHTLTGEYALAEKHYLQQMDLFLKTNRVNHYYFAELLWKLGEVYSELEKYNLAVEMERRAIYLYEQCFGVNTWYLLYVKHSLAKIYSKFDANKAEEIFKECLNLKNMLLYSSHPLNKRVENDARNFYQNIGKNQELERLLTVTPINRKEAILIEKEEIIELKQMYRKYYDRMKKRRFINVFNL